MAIEKIKILRAVLELPAKQYSQLKPNWPVFEINGLDWLCCFAGSSKTDFAIGANNSYEVKNSEIWATAFFKHNNSFIATVSPFRVTC